MKCLKYLKFCLFGGLLFANVHAEVDLIPTDIIEDLCRPYSSEEMALIERDFSNIRDLCFHSCTNDNDELLYVATAGGPGASKSTILENWLEENEKNVVYIDPDQRTLKFMIWTYLQSLTCSEISKVLSYRDLLERAYAKWRSASNYIACSLLNEAFDGYNIAHGTTSTSPAVRFLYEKLKKKNYKIKLLLCGSSDENRVNALEHRAKEQGFCQVAQEDIFSKGRMFFENFPVYFKFADEMHFFWIDNFSEGSTEVATFKKGEGLRVINQEGMDKFNQAYEDAREKSASNLPAFDELM